MKPKHARTPPGARLTHGQLLQLNRWNTPTIYNGWEQITKHDPAADGFNLEEVRDFMPQMGVMVGYAVTVVCEPSNPEHKKNRSAFLDYYRYVATVPGPKIVVVQDLDKPRAIGAFWGEVNANIHKALGCVGTIADGAIRDLDEMTNAGFKALARRLCVGHAHSWPVRWDCEVEVFGRRVKPGQLIHADKHGFLVIPDEDAPRLLEAARFMDANECNHLIATARAAAEAAKPNILFILADDQGYADLGCQSVVKDIKTPHIDALAASGVRCTAGYITAPQCTPSRAGVISGRYQNRLGVEHNGIAMKQDVVTLPEQLKAAGYLTGMSGKWHLDFEDQRKENGPKNRVLPELAPQHQGFDEYFSGFMQDYSASHALDGTPFPDAPRKVRDERCRVVIQTEATLSFLDRRAKQPGQPWFHCLAWMAPHVPLESPEPWFSQTPAHLPKERRQALALIGAIDDGPGRIRAKLKEMGQEQNTLIFLIADNGAPLGRAWDGSINPPWRGEYAGEGDGPQWRCAADSRWLGDKVWRAFQMACIEERLASMKEICCLNKAAARELGRDVSMVANIIPTLSATFLQRDCVDMANFEWPVFETYGSYPNPLGYYPHARLGIGPRMAAKIGATGHAMVDAYVEAKHSGWDGNGFTRRNGQTLHKVIYFDLIANRGIPAFALTWDGAYSPGSVHSAGQLHAFINKVAPLISGREYLADIGLAASSWSQITAQPPFGGWKQEVAKRHFAEFMGWSQYLASARDFPQWDVLPFDDANPAELARFKLIILPSVLVITADQLTALETYLKQGGRLLVTGETGTFTGPQALLMPRTHDLVTSLAQRFLGQVTLTKTKPGLDYHLDPQNTAALQTQLSQSRSHQPVPTATRAPEHVGIYVSESRTTPGELTLDLVYYHHDLTSDTLTPVTETDFEVQLHTAELTAAPQVEVIRYDETAPRNLTRNALPPHANHFENGQLTLRIPPFTHYQLVRITSR